MTTLVSITPNGGLGMPTLRIYQGRKRTHTSDEPIVDPLLVEDLRSAPRYKRAHLWPKIKALKD